jgi:hypothetical protein
VGEVVDVLGGATEMYELDLGAEPDLGQPLLQVVLDRLDVMVDLALDLLYSIDILGTELCDPAPDRFGPVTFDRRELRYPALSGEGDEPLDLNREALAKERLLRKGSRVGLDLRCISPVERR